MCEQTTANSVMRDLWMVSDAAGQEITVNRNKLYALLLKLEREQFENGWAKGHKAGIRDTDDIDEVEW